MLTKLSRLYRFSTVITNNQFSTTTTTTRPPQEPPFNELQRDFLDPAEFFNMLTKQGVDFYTGVPDSLLKDFCAYVQDNVPEDRHVIAANEGLALSLGVGYHLATKKVPFIYLQNSGLGNLVNPLMTLADQKVFKIPMLIMIGWRGEPGKKDEPQHIVQGKLTQGMITAMGIRQEVLPDFSEGASEMLDTAFTHIREKGGPFVLLVKRQNFLNYKLKKSVKAGHLPMNREQAIEVIIPHLRIHDAVVATTGFLSRELYEIRKKNNQSGMQDFYCVGSMGHASSIALGVASMKQSRSVYCFDGDGAALMHLGAMTQVASLGGSNFKHIIFNNGAHDSVGAQPSVGFKIDFCEIAWGCGYKYAVKVQTKEELEKEIKKLQYLDGPSMIEILIRTGARKELGRPKSTTLENKKKFVNFLQM